MFSEAKPGGWLAPELAGRPRRALILAGGGLKVAFQAGVLQVWLDEARDAGEQLRFMHADGASGGVYNLAMWCQGMSGHRIAENWRRFSPVRLGLALNWRGAARGESIFSMRRFRARVMRDTWGLDWQRIRRTDRSASFNIFDVDAQRLRTFGPAQMNEALLVAATSLPMWYPPVSVLGTTYIDGVFVTDANLEAAIAAGADELWVVWTVSTAGRWRNGPVAQYFQVIEACANGALQLDLDRIKRSNQAHAAGRPAEFPQPVRIVALAAEVPAHYLFTFTRRRMAAAVDRGVQHARDWCRERGLDVGPEPGMLTAGGPEVAATVTFRERMTGPVAFGSGDALVGAQLGDARGDSMTLRLRVEIDDLDAFRADREHVAQISGSVDCGILGGRMPIARGSLALLPESGDAPGSTMEYRLDIADGTGRELTLIGVKSVRDDPGPDLWRDTTTLDVRLVPRTDDPGADRPDGTPAPVLSGRLRLSPWSLLSMLTTVRGTAAEPGGRSGPVWPFAMFFLRRLAEIYIWPQPVVAADRRPTGRPAAPGRTAVAEFADWPAGMGPDDAWVFAHNERIVPAPSQRVWELLLDAHGWPGYYPNAVMLEGARRLRRGSVFRWITFGLPITSTVDLLVPPDVGSAGRLGWRWRGAGAHGYHVWLLEPDDRGVRVVTEETQRGSLPWLLRPVLRRLLPLGHELWLRRLARRASRRPRSKRFGAAHR